MNKGTIFRFNVQIEIANSVEVMTSAPEQIVMTLAPNQQRFRLLVVEDNKLNRKLLVSLLKKVGFEVRDATNGQEAINVWEEWQPHLIWMDLRMPVVNGYGATEKIKAAMKKAQTTIDTKIIALTASAFEENKALAIESGCNDFVRKPFREADIFNMMTKHIGVHFVYKEDDKQNQFPAITEQLSIGELHSIAAELPDELREKLIAATNSCDADRIDRIVGDIGLLNNQLGDALKHLSEKFAYNEILDLVEKT